MAKEIKTIGVLTSGGDECSYSCSGSYRDCERS